MSRDSPSVISRPRAKRRRGHLLGSDRLEALGGDGDTLVGIGRLAVVADCLTAVGERGTLHLGSQFTMVDDGLLEQALVLLKDVVPFLDLLDGIVKLRVGGASEIESATHPVVLHLGLEGAIEVEERPPCQLGHREDVVHGLDGEVDGRIGRIADHVAVEGDKPDREVGVKDLVLPGCLAQCGGVHGKVKCLGCKGLAALRL